MHSDDEEHAKSYLPMFLDRCVTKSKKFGTSQYSIEELKFIVKENPSKNNSANLSHLSAQKNSKSPFILHTDCIFNRNRS